MSCICDGTVARPAISLTTFGLTGLLDNSFNPVRIPEVLLPMLITKPSTVRLATLAAAPTALIHKERERHTLLSILKQVQECSSISFSS